MSDHGGLKMRYVYWLAGKLPSCEAITVLVSESHERTLTRQERIRKWLHFTICEWCSRYEKQLALMRSTARGAALAAETSDGNGAPGLSEEARERMRRAIAERR
jgi:hypothetical protein